VAVKNVEFGSRSLVEFEIEPGSSLVQHNAIGRNILNIEVWKWLAYYISIPAESTYNLSESARWLQSPSIGSSADQPVKLIFYHPKDAALFKLTWL
jgi:myo-inositol catabolism protein IolC